MARVAVVTGGTRGIGEAISVALKNAGYKVAANYAGNDERAKAFTDKTGIAAFKWDVSSFDDCAAGMAKVEAALGPVDIIVNNAGITRDATMKKMNRNAWDEVLDTNLGGCFNMCKVAWDGMLNRSFGRIVNIGSINGQAGQYGQVNYAAAKSGIHGFTKALSQEGAAKGITVNAIAPGLVLVEATEYVPESRHRLYIEQRALQREQLPADVSGVALFALSDLARFVTGQLLPVNGGFVFN